MPIDDVTWTNCRHCGHRYADYVKQCPRCSTRTKTNSGKIAGAVGGGIVAVAIIALIILYPGLLSIPNLLNQQNGGTSTIDPDLSKADNGNVVGPDKSPQAKITKTEYVIETRTDVILAAGAFLGPKDVRTFNINIPTENVTSLEGTIVVQGDQFLHIEFTNDDGKAYCKIASQCIFEVYGESSGKPAGERSNEISLPVSGGDRLRLKVTNPESAPLQTVEFDLSVSYQVVRERTVPAVVEEDEQDENVQPAIVPATEESLTPELQNDDEDGHEEAASPEPTSGAGRDIDPAYLSLKVHELINEQRKEHGLKTLQWDDELSIIAEKHSKDMAARGYFEHETPEGKDPTDRAEAAGYHCEKNYGSYYTIGIAENLFQHWTYESITYINGIEFYDWITAETLAREVVEGWMNSPGHRQNILTGEYDREGIGVAVASNDKVYVTENFC